MRHTVPAGLLEWWNENVHDGCYVLELVWRSGGDVVRVGRLRTGKTALRTELAWTDGKPLRDFADGKNRLTRTLGATFTRAGWQRPRLDPQALERLLSLRDSHMRVEFILDTNAIVDGVAHWLVEHFADRADLVVTAVSLRELQDKHVRAKFSQPLPSKKEDRGTVLAARHVYLAANRTRELLSSRTVLWRELALDDTALLLSRGNQNGKSSESDTMLLRAVRRSILDRVNGLERFFVTADVALARRATSELPSGSVIASRIRDVEEGRVYWPCFWWPGVDQGRGIARSVPRLIWELLAVADSVHLRGDPGPSWTFQAFDEELWPSDYSSPWVRIEKRPDADGARETSLPLIPGSKNLAESADLSGSMVWPRAPADAGSLDQNLRLSGVALFDSLASLARSRGEGSSVELTLTGSERSRHLARLLEAARLATIEGDAVRAGPRCGELARAWRANNVEAVFDLLRVWAPLEEHAMLSRPPKRPESTLESAAALAARLGQGMRLEGDWVRGGLRPSVAQIRAAVRQAFDLLPQSGPRALTVHALLVDELFLKLGVAPARIVWSWDELIRAGAFDDVEFRAGGSSSQRRQQEVVTLYPGGWDLQRLDLESVHDYRDLVPRSAHSA